MTVGGRKGSEDVGGEEEVNVARRVKEKHKRKLAKEINSEGSVEDTALGKIYILKKHASVWPIAILDPQIRLWA